MNRLVGVVLLAASVLVIGSGHLAPAYAATSNEMLADLEDATNRLLALEGFVSRSDQVYRLTMGSQGGRWGVVDFNYRADIASQVEPNEGDIVAHVNFDITFSSNTAPGPMTVRLEMFKDDETLYGRITDADLGPGNRSSPSAAGWVNMDLLPDQASPAYQYINDATFLELYGMNYPLSPGSVGSVVELDPEEIDGQTMRVLRLEYTSQALDAAGVMDDMIDVFNGQAMGDTTADLTRQMLEGATFSLTVSIGADDHLPHVIVDRIIIQSELAVGNITLPVSGEMTLTTTLADFNQPLELSPPDIP